MMGKFNRYAGPRQIRAGRMEQPGKLYFRTACLVGMLAITLISPKGSIKNKQIALIILFFQLVQIIWSSVKNEQPHFK
jgi:hypothetical protein